jgi:hypothetical protein
MLRSFIFKRYLESVVSGMKCFVFVVTPARDHAMLHLRHQLKELLLLRDYGRGTHVIRSTLVIEEADSYDSEIDSFAMTLTITHGEWKAQRGSLVNQLLFMHNDV